VVSCEGFVVLDLINGLLLIWNFMCMCGVGVFDFLMDNFGLWSSWLVMMIVSVIGMIVCRLRVYYSGKLSSVVVSG